MAWAALPLDIVRHTRQKDIWKHTSTLSVQLTTYVHWGPAERRDCCTERLVALWITQAPATPTCRHVTWHSKVIRVSLSNRYFTLSNVGDPDKPLNHQNCKNSSIFNWQAWHQVKSGGFYCHSSHTHNVSPLIQVVLHLRNIERQLRQATFSALCLLRYKHLTSNLYGFLHLKRGAGPPTLPTTPLPLTVSRVPDRLKILQWRSLSCTTSLPRFSSRIQ